MAEKKYVVSGPVAVVATVDGSERYLYRGAPVTSETVTPESIKHLLSVGLISEAVEAEKATDSEAKPEDKYKGVSADDLKTDLEKRNEGRDDADKIVPAEPGNKAEVLAALIADDAAQAAKAAQQ